jgi:hypothetical protein
VYVNLDENGELINLTDEEQQEVNDLLAFRDENGNIIPSADEPAVESNVVDDSNIGK